MSKPEVIILHETITQSITKACFSFGALTAAVGIGVWLDSQPLQWIGGIIWILWMLSRAAALAGDKRSHFTISEARKRLDEIEARRTPTN